MSVLDSNNGKEIKLGDGKKYMIAPATLHTMAILEQGFECDIDVLRDKIVERSATGMEKLLWLLLKENYPDMTQEEAGRLVKADQVRELIKELSDILEGLMA